MQQAVEYIHSLVVERKQLLALNAKCLQMADRIQTKSPLKRTGSAAVKSEVDGDVRQVVAWHRETASCDAVVDIDLRQAKRRRVMPLHPINDHRRVADIGRAVRDVEPASEQVNFAKTFWQLC